jgi:hypothetical protein
MDKYVNWTIVILFLLLPLLMGYKLLKNTTL